jgi:short-subunit dehydrogenase
MATRNHSTSSAKKRGGAVTRQTALITGASSGIGEALAKCFAENGFDLVLVARSVEKLKNLAAELSQEYAIKAWVAPADLSQPEALAKLATAMRRARRPIEVLVNNAGVLEHGAFARMNPQRHRDMIDLNVSGLTQMVACFAPDMIKRGSGRILNVASIAAFQPIPSFEACMRGEVIRVPGAINQASIIAGRATPKWLIRKVGGAMVRALGES